MKQFSDRFTPSSWDVVRGAVAASMLFAVSLVASPVFAQGTSEQTGGDAAGDATDIRGPLGDELKRYWSVDRDVEVLKDRMYDRAGRFSVGLTSGFFSSQPFHWYIPVGARLDYHITNQWAVELEGTYMDGPLRQRTDLTSFLKEPGPPNYEPGVDGLDVYKWRAHALAIWSPLYGKLAILQRKLSHLDFNVAAGLGAVSVLRPNETRSGSVEKVLPELALGAGMQFFASNHWVIRLSGRAYVHQGPLNFKNTNTNDRVVAKDPAAQGNPYKELNFFQKLNGNAEFLLGVNYMF